MLQSKITFIGAGNMASAMAGGLINRGYSEHLITMVDVNESTLLDVRQKYGVNTSQNAEKALTNQDIVILAVKPQVMKLVLSDLKDKLISENPIIISIAAGITCTQMQNWTSEAAKIIRVMPNTPALIEQGAMGLYANENVSDDEKAQCLKLLQSIGLGIWFKEESQIDAVTALSGSGPAYFFLLMEQMIKAGVALGLSEAEAKQLTLQTAIGASQLAITSEDSPAVLRTKVTSPNGTTEAAIKTMLKEGVAEGIGAGIKAAEERSISLSKELD
jgi:pyrroline-5-carboxylate reductase